jgi:hypothetical protein
VLSNIIHDLERAPVPDHPRQLPLRDETQWQIADHRVVLEIGDAPHLGKMLEIIMLTVTGGQERPRA